MPRLPLRPMSEASAAARTTLPVQTAVTGAAAGAPSALDTRACERGIPASPLALCVDCGTSFVKTLLLDESGFALRKYDYLHFPYESVSRAVTLNHARLLVTGARADMLDTRRLPPPDARYAEIDCIAEVARCVGLDRAVVACLGTGTPFVVYEGGVAEHFGGTGIGGGTFLGLCERLLGLADPAEA
ncbi:MAG: hypothetical protein LBU58_11725, partial [Clostridiales bacterium]|nr:hypothetical protein [Clostridiales bacterium]